MDRDILQKLDNFFKQYRPLKIKKGQLLYQPEDLIQNIYYLKNGLVRQYIISETGNEATINIFRPNSFFPIMLVLASQPNKYYFEAQTNLEAYEAPSKKVVEFLQSDPNVTLDLTKRFASAIVGLSSRIEELTFEESLERIKSLLVYLASRFGQKNQNEILINLPLTHKDISTWVNLTRETTSRNLEQLEKEGTISYTHKFITIKNLKKLQKDW